MKNSKLLMVLLITLITACKVSRDIHHKKYNNESLYQQSITQAMSPNSSKINYNLIAINHQNKKLEWKSFDGQDYLLLVAWKGTDSYYRPYLDSAFYNTGKYPIWVTTSPELYERMKRENAEDSSLRLKQLLGLPPDDEYKYFIEFWVKTVDLFRPCPDNEIDDTHCDLCFPEGTDTSYKDWINENRISRYYNCSPDDNYPWTQLGYTYDWNSNNVSHIGLSEFVIKPNSNIKVKHIYTTLEYLNLK